MSRFGLNGYLCDFDVAEDGESYLLTVTHDNYPELTASKTVAVGDLNPEWPANSREQHEELFAPLFAELEDKRLDLDADKRKQVVDDETARERAESKAQLEHAAATAPGQVAKDGTSSGGVSTPEGGVVNTEDGPKKAATKPKKVAVKDADVDTVGVKAGTAPIGGAAAEGAASTDAAGTTGSDSATDDEGTDGPAADGSDKSAATDNA